MKRSILVSRQAAVTGVAALVKEGGNQSEDETKDAGKEAKGKKKAVVATQCIMCISLTLKCPDQWQCGEIG